MTIDWIHDAIKDSLRRRKLRNKKHTEGIRGALANLWDGSQGWILATCIGENSHKKTLLCPTHLALTAGLSMLRRMYGSHRFLDHKLGDGAL